MGKLQTSIPIYAQQIVKACENIVFKLNLQYVMAAAHMCLKQRLLIFCSWNSSHRKHFWPPSMQVQKAPAGMFQYAGCKEKFLFQNELLSRD